MGFDMYLTQHIFVGKLRVKLDGKTIQINPDHIVVHGGHWVKAYAVHRWFVENCLIGKEEEDCTFPSQNEVTYEDLQKLRALCAKVIETRNWRLLPPGEDPFGSSTIDRDYYRDLADTVNIIDALVPSKSAEYYYSFG